MKKHKIRSLASLFLMMLLVGCVYNYKTTTVRAASNIEINATHPAMNTIKLSWNKVSGAAGYNIYYSQEQEGAYELVASIGDTSVIFDNLDTDKYYYFKVVPYTLENGSRIEGEPSEIVKERSNRIGIDVSKWQGNINWTKVKEDGIDFAIVRVAYGASSAAETKYKQNIEGAIQNGIPVGVYIYSTAKNVEMAKKEAEYVVSIIKGYDLSYPVCYDIEDAKIQGVLSKSTNTSMVKAFFDVIEKAGYEPMLYTGDNFSDAHLNMDQLTMYDWWIPHYATSDYYYEYRGNYHFKSGTEKVLCKYYNYYQRMWQYSERGKVSGITGTVDMNYELDLDEETTGIVYVDKKKQQQRYVAGEYDTIKTIAAKLGVSEEKLVMLNPQYNAYSQIAKGESIIIDTLVLTVPMATVQMESPKSMKISYKPVALAEGYEIYHSTSKNGKYNLIATTKELEFIHTNVSASVTNYYKVVAYRTLNGVYEAKTSSIVSCKITVDKPTELKAASNSYNSVKVTWAPVNGAEGYNLYSSTSQNGTYNLIKKTKATSFTDKNLQNNKTVYYKVRAYVKGTDKEVESSWSARVSAKPVQAPATGLKTSSVTNNSVKLTWAKAAGANAYKVYRATSLNGKYTCIATVTSKSYTNKSLTSNKTYYYKVRAIKKVDNVEYKAQDTAVLKVVTVMPAKLTAPKVTQITPYESSVYMKWSTVKQATGYEVYRSTSKNGTYKRVVAKSAPYINNTGLQKKVTYYYKVRAYQKLNGSTYYSPYSSISSVKTLGTIVLPVPKIKTIKGYSNKITISWAAEKNVSGYEVYCATTKNGTYKKIMSKNATSLNNTGLTKNKTYYYKVRSYQKINGKTYYSKYSSIVSAKTL